MTKGKRPYVGNHPHGKDAAPRKVPLTKECVMLGFYRRWAKPWDYEFEESENAKDRPDGTR